jgi:hypothetical protein
MGGSTDDRGASSLHVERDKAACWADFEDALPGEVYVAQIIVDNRLVGPMALGRAFRLASSGCMVSRSLILTFSFMIIPFLADRGFYVDWRARMVITGSTVSAMD